ncbi:MAG: thioredoxin [Anaerolineales bacterium]|nr:thioredoxin [Anaerolineales bacterium]
MAAAVFDTPLNTTDQSLDRVLRAGLPVALIFADGPTPFDAALNDLARAEAGKLLVVKIKPGENPESARRFQVRTPPVLVTVRAGAALTTAQPVGAADLSAHVAYLLGRGPRPEPKAPPRTEAPAAAGAAGAAHPLTVTDASFEADVLRAAEPVLVDFWAPWCGPCRMVAPTVEKLAGELAGRLRVAKVNTDENPRVARQFDIQGIPTMMIFQGGRLVTRWSGAEPEGAIRRRLQQAVGLG